MNDVNDVIGWGTLVGTVLGLVLGTLVCLAIRRAGETLDDLDVLRTGLPDDACRCCTPRTRNERSRR